MCVLFIKQFYKCAIARIDVHDFIVTIQSSVSSFIHGTWQRATRSNVYTPRIGCFLLQRAYTSSWLYQISIVSKSISVRGLFDTLFFSLSNQNSECCKLHSTWNLTRNLRKFYSRLLWHTESMHTHSTYGFVKTDLVIIISSSFF